MLIAFAGLALAAPAAAHADSATVADTVGDIQPGPEISDITGATVSYSAGRLRITVTHSSWAWQLGRYRAATGGRITFGNGRTYVITPNMNGRRSLLFTLNGLLRCPEGKTCALPCRGWRHWSDPEGLTTGVRVPTTCFGRERLPDRVKVMPLHVIPVQGKQPVVDPVSSTPWIARG
jgi:hypothetical protein